MIAISSIRTKKLTLTLFLLASSLSVTAIFSLTVGSVTIPFSDVCILLFKKLGFFTSYAVDATHSLVLYSIRIPRIVMTILIGSGLGISGAVLQAMFRNPLVEPSLIGVSGGATASVVLWIVFTGSFSIGLSPWLQSSILSIVAFVGGSIATFAVYRLSCHKGNTNTAVLILAGVAVNALSAAIIGITIFYSNENQLRMFLFWTLGDVGGASWNKLVLAGPLLLASTILLAFYSSSLNALSLGEAEAFHLGVNVEKVKRNGILLCALCIGICVSLAGMIGFVGLVVPHMLRSAVTTDNRFILPASALFGAILLLLADMAARMLVRPSELPIGVVTSLIGAPFFIALLIKSKRNQEL